MTNEKKQEPLKAVKFGQLDMTVWENDIEIAGKPVKTKSIQISKWWKTQDNTFDRRSVSFGINEAYKLHVALGAVLSELLFNGKNKPEE